MPAPHFGDCPGVLEPELIASGGCPSRRSRVPIRSALLFATTTGQQLAKLMADDAAEQNFFDGSVGISGTSARPDAADRLRGVVPERVDKMPEQPAHSGIEVTRSQYKHVGPTAFRRTERRTS